MPLFHTKRNCPQEKRAITSRSYDSPWRLKARRCDRLALSRSDVVPAKACCLLESKQERDMRRDRSALDHHPLHAPARPSVKAVKAVTVVPTFEKRCVPTNSLRLPIPIVLRSLTAYTLGGPNSSARQGLPQPPTQAPLRVDAVCRLSGRGASVCSCSVVTPSAALTGRRSAREHGPYPYQRSRAAATPPMKTRPALSYASPPICAA